MCKFESALDLSASHNHMKRLVTWSRLTGAVGHLAPNELVLVTGHGLVCHDAKPLHRHYPAKLSFPPRAGVRNRSPQPPLTQLIKQAAMHILDHSLGESTPFETHFDLWGWLRLKQWLRLLQQLLQCLLQRGWRWRRRLASAMLQRKQRWLLLLDVHCTVALLWLQLRR